MDASAIQKLVNEEVEKKILEVLDVKNESFHGPVLQVLEYHGLVNTLLNNNLKIEHNKQKLNDIYDELIAKNKKLKKKNIELEKKIEEFHLSIAKIQKYNIENNIKFKQEVDKLNLVKKSILNFGGTMEKFKEKISNYENLYRRVNSLELNLEDTIGELEKKIESELKIKKSKTPDDKCFSKIENLRKKIEILEDKINILDKKNNLTDESLEINRKELAKIQYNFQENYEVADTTNKLFSTQISDLESNHKTTKQEQERLNDLMTKINKQVVLNTTSISTSLEDNISFQIEKILSHISNSHVNYEQLYPNLPKKI